MHELDIKESPPPAHAKGEILLLLGPDTTVAELQLLAIANSRFRVSSARNIVLDDVITDGDLPIASGSNRTVRPVSSCLDVLANLPDAFTDTGLPCLVDLALQCGELILRGLHLRFEILLLLGQIIYG